MFTGDNGAYWDGVNISYSSNNNVLDYVTIEYGGASTTGANLIASATTSSPSKISVTNTTLRNSLGNGFRFADGTIIPTNGFSNVTVTGNAQRPGRVPDNLIGSLDPTSHYTGNGNNGDQDQMEVFSTSGVTTDQTWPALDVPYFMGSDNYYIESALTIAPNTTFIFQSSGSVYVQSTGTLTAKGSSTAPIVFTSVNNTTYWDGLNISYSSNNNVLDYVTVEYGGASATGANLTISSTTSSPAQATVTNSTFSNSAGYGIWVGAGANYNGDIPTSNQFLNNTVGTILIN